MRRLAATGLLSLVLLVVVHRHAVDAIEIKHDYKFKNKISALLQRVDSSASGSGSSGSVISGNSYSSTTPSTTTTTTTSPTTSRQDASLVNITSVSPVTSAAAAATAAALISGNSTEDAEKPEELPEALELRYTRPGQKYRIRRPAISLPTRRATENRRSPYQDKIRLSSGRPGRRPGVVHDPKRAPTDSECTFFSKTVCLEAADYPIEAIMRSIRNNKDMVSALLTDFKIKDYNNNLLREDDEVFLPTARPGLLGSSSSSYKTSYDHHHQGRYHRDKPNLSLSPYDNRFESNEIKRKYESYNEPLDNVEEGFTCPSQVKYAKPQLARAASGVWKYIINTDEHTQTLRLEKCSTPRQSCSFISENYRSTCMQVYNYHRLLTWDSKLGLHMDIFKVPTCCSCHVQGYTDIFPPHQTDPPLKPHESFPGVDFVQSDHHPFGKGSSSSSTRYHGSNSIDNAALSLFRDHYINSDPDELQLQHSSSARRPSIAKPPRTRRPSSSSSSSASSSSSSKIPRPFDKLPQQHAPNTRAPGYKGGHRPSHRPNRPFRRESALPDTSDYTENGGNLTRNRFSQSLDQDSQEPGLRLQSGFDEEYQETNRRINYNYHPILDFFKPEAAMLKSEEPISTGGSGGSASQTTGGQVQLATNEQQNSWQPLFKS
ncbi:neurotrophin 1 [Trichogramma pretiosum]|uniref:neurotrophin 1 n=1 Tax=Trichogramma pretiosum TaxID=7493 RepID=UPI000C71BBB2|nr:neurotrophin 1 [Trichogramma pretiosum]